ncbi:MAG: ABC transporter ATP-binding protein [Elusimicrobiota bacterium]
MKRSFFSDIARRFPGLLAANIVVLLFVGLLDAASVLAVAPVVDSLLNPDPLRTSGITRHFTAALSALGLPAGLKTLLLCFLAFNVLSSASYICARYLILRTKYAVSRDLLVGTFEDFFNARWQFFSGNEQGTLLNTFTREMGVVGDAFGAMAVFAANIIQISLFLAVPLWLSWQVTLLSLGAALLLAAPFLLLGRLNYRLGTENTRTANRLSSVIHESLTSAKVIMGFGSQDRCLASLDTAFEEHRRVTLKSQTLSLATPYLYQPLGLSVLIIAFFSAQSQGLPLSAAAVLLYSLLRVLPIIGRVAEQKNALDNFFPSYEQVDSLRAQARGLRQAGGSRPFTGFAREIALSGLVFAHPGRERALDGVSLKIPKGSLVALVGESGAGKSTLIDMLMGFHEPQGGAITFDGVDLRDFDLGAYRRRLGYVPQDSLLFNLSIRDNLLWSQPDASKADLERACRLAHASEFIDQLPEGFATVVGDRGVRLSGGQIQRLALARAILRRPELLILDEATSALDSQSERLIQSAVEAIAKDTTIVVIAHRLSTIKNADHVYVLSRGRIVEEGRYADLIGKGGAFQKMAQLQVLETTTGGAA